MMKQQRITQLTDDAVQELKHEAGSCARPVELAKPIRAALETLHRDMPRCDACESAHYRRGRADALAEVMAQVRQRAGTLFADGHDTTATYLRDTVLPPFKTTWHDEVRQIEYCMNQLQHTCTFDGLPPT